MLRSRAPSRRDRSSSDVSVASTDLRQSTPTNSTSHVLTPQQVQSDRQSHGSGQPTKNNDASSKELGNLHCSVLLSRLSANELTKPCSVVLCDLDSDSDDKFKSGEWGQNVPDLSQEEIEDDFVDDVIESSQQQTPTSSSTFTTVKNKTTINSFYEYPTILEGSDDDSPDTLQQPRSASSKSGKRDQSLPPIILSSKAAPSLADVSRSFKGVGVPGKRYQDVHCSNRADVPPEGIELGMQKLLLSWERDLPEFQSNFSISAVSTTDIRGQKTKSECKRPSSDDSKSILLQSLKRAPMRKEVCCWLRTNRAGAAVVDATTLKKRQDSESDSQMFNPDRTVLRVRQDSGDSLGSELSVSSIEDEDDDHKAGKVVSDLNRTQLSGAAKRRRVSFQTQLKEIRVSDQDCVVSSQVCIKTISDTGKLKSALSATPHQSLRSYLSKKVSGGLNPRASPSSPIQGATLNNTYAFKMSLDNLEEARAVSLHHYLTVMSMELFASTRQKLRPDPEFDSVQAIFVVVTCDIPDTENSEIVFLVDGNPSGASSVSRVLPSSKKFRCLNTELELLSAFIEFVKHCDPDIMVGYEVQASSWGYLIERASHLDLDLAPMLSRLPSAERESALDSEGDRFGSGSDVRIAGRVVLNVWRLLRSEVALYSYTFENTMFHVLHRRVPKFEYETLTQWWNTSHLFKWRVLEYFMCRTHGDLLLLEQLDLVGRTSELAKLFGCQFEEVLSRGSQFRVESIMLRMAKRRNLVAVSPGIQQRARMKAPEYIPLVMEPESRFYVDPVIVLDFQSLYPSIIMAYNYCYSTCLGRVEELFKSGEPYKFGCTQLKISPQRLAKLIDHVTISPGGVAFLKPNIRRGLLPQMLEEILETRFMVKRSMKLHGDSDGKLKRVLHSRQLGLKLIANVTYGYTSANFSGRMPCMEVADSVVSKGRETLERAIRTIEEGSSRWGGPARVVYGDTDSVFVLLRGRTKEEAFRIGQDMAEAVTAENPKPVKLKFEKVYLPCILQTKKRYVGYMYESVGQKEPKYDAKGIETVRRDGCPAVAKILEKSLKVLFETKDVSRVKLFVQRQFQKISLDRASLQDLTFAREFRGLQGYKPGACIPALELTRRQLRHDRRGLPRTGERVPYVVVHGEPGRPLIQSVRCPSEVLARWPAIRPNDRYYVTKVVAPPLNRCLSLVGADVLKWYAELPKVHRPRLILNQDPEGGKVSGGDNILRYFASRHCPACFRLVEGGGGSTGSSLLCRSCSYDPQRTALELSARIRRWDHSRRDVITICQQCTGFFSPKLDCSSLDCPVVHRAAEAHKEAAQIEYVQHNIMDKIVMSSSYVDK